MTWVTDHIFVAGGQLVVEDWAAVQAQTEVTAVVTLALEQPGIFTHPTPWAWLWLTVDDEPSYTLEHLKLGVHFVQAAQAAGRRVLLHAPKGVHRTRPLVGACMLAHGKSFARVIRELEQRPWLPPYKGDAELLRNFAAGGEREN